MDAIDLDLLAVEDRLSIDRDERTGETQMNDIELAVEDRLSIDRDLTSSHSRRAAPTSPSKIDSPSIATSKFVTVAQARLELSPSKIDSPSIATAEVAS